MAIKSVRELFQDNGKSKTTSRGFTSVRDLYATEENLKPFYESFQSALSNWSTASTEYYKSVEDYYKNLDQSSYGLENANKWKNDISTRNQWLLDEADRLNKVLDDYGRYFDSATIADIRKMFGDTRKGLNSILTQADKDIEYWNQFKDEGEYHDYYFGNKYKNITYAEADEAWRKTEGKESDWIYNNLDNFKSSAELQAEIDATKKEYGLDGNKLVQALEYGVVDFLDSLDSVVSSSREWAKNEVARLTELKASADRKAEKQEFYTAFLPSRLNPEIETPDYDLYVNKGKDVGIKDKSTKHPLIGIRENIPVLIPFDEKQKYEKYAKHMENDEYNDYLYLLGQYGDKVANKYLEHLEETIDTREAYAIADDWDIPVLDHVFNAYASLQKWGDDMESIFSDGYKAPSSIQMANQILGSDKEGWEKTLWDLESNIVYQVPNILGGVAATAILGPGGLGVMGATTAASVGQLGLTGLSSFGSAKQEMLNLGYDVGQANMYGLLTGASEVGLGALIGKIGNVSGVWTDDVVKSLTKGLNSAGAKFAIEFGAGMVSEGIEEALQEMLNPFFQKIATGKNEGISWEQVGYAGLLGALSAGVMNGFGAGATRLGERSVAKDIKKKDGWVDSVKKIGDTFSADTLAYKLAGKVTEKTSVGQLATLIHEMNGTLSEQNKADIKYQLMREGVTESDAETISKWLAKAVDGENFTALQRKALDNNPIIEKVFKNVVLDQNSTVNQRIQALMDIYGKSGKAGVDLDALEKSQSKEALSTSATVHMAVEGMQKDAIKGKYNLGRPSVGNYDAILDSLVGKAKDAVSKAKISESGATTDATTGKQIDIKRVAETDGKTATYALADGTVISNKNVEYSDSDEGLLYEGAISLGYDADITNAIIHGKNGVDIPVMAYLNGVDEAIEYGRIGYPMDKISTNGFYADLPDSMKTYAYNLGKESAKKDTEKRQAKVDANKGKVKKAREGEVVHLYENSGLTSRQEASITTLGKVVSDITHNQVYIYDTVERVINGKKVRVFAQDTAHFKAGTPADNGFINKATGEIYIDLHAGMNGEGVILWTLAHELTHFVRQWSPAKFNVLADFLMAEYGKQGVDVQTLIDNKVANSRNKLTRDQAYEEVVADAMQTMFTDTDLASKLEKLKNKDKGLWNKIKAFFADLYKRIVGEYKGVDAQTNEAKEVRKMSKETIKRLSDLFAEGIVDAGDTFANLDVEGVMTDIANSLPSESTATTDPNGMVAHSYRSFAEACGFEAYEDPDTSIRSWRFKGSTNSVNEVTEHQIRNSPIGALINYSATKKYISYEDAQAQYKMFAEIANMCIRQQDFAQAMQFVGSMVFTGMKANADKQYKTTYDFPSICTKTQAVIDAMSDAMIKKGAGLTKAELEALYRKVWEMGNPVPCPECYVFSRWVGIGGLLDNIRKYQDTYSKMTMAEVEAEYQKMKAEIEEFSKANGISFGKAKGKIFDLYAKEEAKLMEEIAKLEEAGDIVPQSKKDRLAKISLQKDTTKAMSWIHKVYFANESHTKVNPNYLVPIEVLFDLNAGETFATKYKEAWGFRTTQGAGYGKAITPYAEAVLGEGIAVTNNTTKTIKGKANRDTSSPKSNIFLEQNGTLSNEAIKILETARRKQLAQAFLGGQRLQSTSDARYENVTDYLIAAIEMQAMHSKAQVYTKVSGAVEAFNNWGFAINQSLMPLNSGLTKDGRLKDTSSGGMKVDVAYANRTRFENAGTITIGVNDAHIRTLFRERGRDFIIPYHASGGDQTLIREFRRIQDSKAGNETFVQSCDYSKTQSEKELPTSLLRELGYTDEQIADVEKFREQRLAILTRNKAVDMEYIRAEGNEVLSRLYDEFNGGIWDGVKLTKDTVGTSIFPNEYWDKSVDYDHSSKITEDYLEYCRRLGFLHKFSGKSIQYNKNLQKHQLIEVMGYNENGERVALTELAYIDGDPSKGVEQFFWKTLTDRRMYGNDGKYLEQKFVTLGNADASVAETFAKDNEGSVREYSKEKSDATLKTIKVEDGKVSLADNFMFSFRNSNSGMANDALTPYNEEQTRFIKQRGDYIIDSFDKLKEIVNLAFDEPDVKAIAHFGMVDVATLQKIKNSIPNLPKSMAMLFTDNRGYSIATTLDGIRHIVKEKKLTRQDVLDYLDRFADTIVEYDEVDFHYYNRRGLQIPGLLFRKDFPDGKYISYDLVSQEKQSLLLQSLYLDGVDYNKKRKSADPLLMHHNAPASTSKTRGGQTSTNMVAQNPNSVNTSDKFSFSERTEAPTFYSHMGKVIDDIKIAKMGAGGVVSYLKGRGVKNEEIKWSGIEAFLEGKKSVTKDELREFVAGSMLSIEEEMSGADIDLRYDGTERAYKLHDSTGKVIDTFTYNEFLGGYVADSDEEVYSNEIELREALREEYGQTSAPRWADHRLDGGENYRELVFKMPNSSYTNFAMRVHWGDDAEGVLAHARIQDFETSDGKKMLFIEEIQSDWHNAGHKHGYFDKSKEVNMKTTTVKHEDGVYRLYRGEQELYAHISDSVLESRFPNGITEEQIHQGLVDKHNNALPDVVPEAPFKDTYHEYVLKRLIRMAAEEGYDSIGWTPAYIQSFRWSEDYEEGYRIEYDQDIPSFLKKYGKKWGATVGKAEIEVAEHIESGEHYDAENVEVWSMDITDSMRESVLYEGQVMYSERILMGSLFSGGGTLEAGLTYQMLDKQFGVEYDGKIASVYADNHGDHIQVGRVEDFDISKYKDIFYLHASPVCHNFSKAKHGAKELQMDIDSAMATAKHLETAMPQVFTVENAPGYRKSQSLKIITDKLTELGYKWDVDVYNSADYGSATSRNRVILRAVKDGELPAKPTKQSRTNSWDKVTRDLWDTLPKSSLRPSFISAIENTPSLPILDANGKVNVNKPLLILTTTNGHQVTYSWEGEVCPTLTTKCGEAKLVMPNGNIYAVTPEFMGRIQGLPTDYKYPKEKTRAFTIIGNGIPTHLTKAVVGGVLDSAYEQTHNGDILFSERNSIPVDNRSLLANALESVAQNDVEREWISRYKSKIEELNDAQNKLAELRAEIHKIRFSKGQDRKKLPELENQADILAERINRADKKLLTLEASKPLQKVIDRERAKAYKLGMEKLANYRKERAESKALNYYRPRIEKIVSDLSTRLANPSAKTAIPEAFGASVAKVLSAFTFTTYDKDGNIRPTKANVKRAEAKRDLETLAELLEQNSIEAEYGQLDIPPEMLEWIKSVATYFDAAENLASNEFDVNKMNEEQLKGAYKFLRSLQTAINNAGKYYTSAHYNVTDDARSTMEYVGELPNEVNETLQKASKMFKWDFASPVTVFDRFGEGGKHVYSMLVKGQSKMAYNVQEILDFVEKAYTEKEAKEWREKLVTVEIGGEEFNVTVEMLMGLHCLLRQEDSKRHILEGGGIRFADVKNKGKVKRYENIFFNEIDAMAVEKALDEFPRAREVAEAMQKFMESTGSAWGNEVSMIRFGYHAFTTPNYYPIRTIAAGSEYEAQQKRASIYALLNKSFTKERNIKANNAVIVDGIFSVFNNHMAEMALYNAWALPVIDTIKWFNYSETQDIDAKKPEKSVHETFRLAYGTYADEYVRRLLESINNQTDNGLSEEWAFINLRKVNRVAVAWNVRVAIQQPFSITRAFELINPKYITPLVGKARDVAYEEMLANSGIAKWKSMGYYDVDVSRPLETQVMKNASVADKFTEVGMKAAEDGDSFTWTALWNACKKETAEKNKGISEEELLKKTTERFNDLVLRTQVVDSVLTKPQWLRSKGFWHKSTSAFMSEPLASYNALLRQADKFARDKSINGAKDAVRNNAKAITRATGIFILTQLVNALVTAPIDGLRDDDDYETYLEKVLASFKENAVMNLLPTSLLPYVSDIVEYAMYGRTDRADLSLWVGLIDLGKQTYNLFDPDKYSYHKLHKTFNSMLKVGSQFSGFAVSNMFRDVLSVYNAVAGALGYGELKFQTNEDTHSEGYKRMYDAIASGDTDRAGYLYGQLLSNGVEEDKIYNGLTKCVKEAFQDGNITEEEATKLLKEIIGFVGKTDSEGNPPTADDIYWMIDRWKYTKKEGYSRYDDLYEAMENGDPTSALEWHIEKKTEAYLEEARRDAEKDGKTFNETKAKKEAKAKAESAVKSAISSYWKPKYKEAYKKGDTEEMKRIRYILRDTKLYGSVSDILDTCKGWLKD